jgi:hypothetical protein
LNQRSKSTADVYLIPRFHKEIHIFSGLLEGLGEEKEEFPSEKLWME